jgi:ATP-dependent exoDNAse (exonuclease V) beta subunit
MRDFFLNKLEIYDDPEFKFDAIKHKYTYDGIDFISVTQFISRFHKKFDSEFWSKKKAEERGVDQQLVLKEWQTLNDRANFIGTSTHNWIENYFNRQFQDLPNDLDVIDRINKFNKIYATHLHKLTPIKFEQRIFSKKWKIAGMIDSIFLWKGNLVMVDYKTNKKFETSNSHGEKLLSPFQDYDKCHLTEYSIQLSLYKLILKEIELDVKVCYLLYIGPDDEAKVHKCHDFSSILEDYLIRLEYLSQITFNPD